MDRPARDEINHFLKSVGFKYVTIDLQGFRSGSSNEELDS
jgi:PP-loop superfamily ATP-utilizing enzyme